MPKSILVKSFVLTAFVAFAVALTVLALRPHYIGTRAGKTDENYSKSENCLGCHEDHYESWRRTHHSRMTQDAKAETIQGDFHGRLTDGWASPWPLPSRGLGKVMLYFPLSVRLLSLEAQ